MSHGLKIGVACYPTYGGSGVIATELGLALAGRGHEVHFLSYENPIRLTSFHDNVYYHRVTVQDYPLFKYPPYALALATKMAEIAEQAGLDLFHVHYAIPHSVSAYLAREMLHNQALKIIVTLHGTDITIVGNDPSYKRVTQFCIRAADGVTAVSRYLASETQRFFEIDSAIEVIPNFVDMERFDARPCPKAASLRHSDERVLIHVSNFRPVKQVPLLIRAFAEVQNELNARLLLVGDGPDFSHCQELARQLGVAKRVNFMGSQQAVEKILSCADVFVLPSKYESFGLAALEAMACGVPVIGSDIGGLAEVVEHGETGFLCSVDSAADIAAAIRQVLADPDHCKAMGKKAREQTQERFSLPRILNQYESFYDRILTAGGVTQRS